MKKIYYYAMAFLLFLTTSCVSEKIETQEDRSSYNPEAVWEYNGDNTTLNKVIEELKNSPNREKLERRLLKNKVLWENAKPILSGNKKRILVPFLSVDKENVIGVLALVKDSEGKITFDMVVRKDLVSKSAMLPFWKRGIWNGYFMALDKNILGIKNGSPGFVEKLMDKNSKVKNSNSKTMGTECGEIKVGTMTITYYECEYEWGESSPTNCWTTGEEEFDLYDWRCWDVPDAPEDPIDATDPPQCPEGFEMNASGECVPINECNNTDPETFFNSFVISDELISVTPTNQTSSKLNQKTTSGTHSKFYNWYCVKHNLYYKIISTEIGVTKLTGNPSYPKEFVSLTHVSLTPQGTMFCGSISITSEASNVTLGKYFAEMELTLGLHASYDYKGKTINRYFFHTPKKTFSANE